MRCYGAAVQLFEVSLARLDSELESSTKSEARSSFAIVGCERTARRIEYILVRVFGKKMAV